MYLVALMLACAGGDLEAQNVKLQQRVSDLERANTRLEEDKKTLQQSVSRMEEQAKAARRLQEVAALGMRPGQKIYATFVTSAGQINCTLRAEQAPITVRNFVELATGRKEWQHPATGAVSMVPLYNGTMFHRVVPGFMIQGGDPLGNGTGGPGYTFEDEVGPQTVFDKPGLLAMANAGPNTNGSQFFITEGTPTHLNGKHTIFGDCTDANVVRAISAAPRDGERPLSPTMIYQVAVAIR
jgi:peptidyl-prolyl cis-trans isomerase A (cyclophilin A)